MPLEIDEFGCKGKNCCGGKVALDSQFFALARRARVISGCSYFITSGYRCEKHNTEVGSTSKNHTSGKAMDIRVTSSEQRSKILCGLYGAGFKRIGISKDGFIHADTMDLPEACWIY